MDRKKFFSTMNTEIREGPNCYENQLRAMSMCWSGFDPMGSYGATSNYSHQSGTLSALPMTIATQNDQQVIYNLFKKYYFITKEPFCLLTVGVLFFIKPVTLKVYCYR